MGAAHCSPSEQPAAAAAAAASSRVPKLPRPRGREARRVGKAKMQARIIALQTQCEHLQQQVKTLQTQCGLLTDLLDKHVCELLPAGHPSPALIDGNDLSTTVTAGHSSPVLFDLFADDDNNN
eukprot:8727470-Karenia_brevis.AAC.1